MRQTILLIILALSMASSAYAATSQTIQLDVQNMTCPVCPFTVKKSLEMVPGVTAAKIDFDHKSAIVSFNPDRTTPEAITKATENAGYPSTIKP